MGSRAVTNSKCRRHRRATEGQTGEGEGSRRTPSGKETFFCCLFSSQLDQRLTDVCAEAGRDVQRDGEGEVAGGRVEAGLQVAPVSGHAHGLSGPALVLVLDLLLALQAHRILQNTNLFKKNTQSKCVMNEEKTHL